jgi:hypothetical protein
MAAPPLDAPVGETGAHKTQTSMEAQAEKSYFSPATPKAGSILFGTYICSHFVP